MEITTKSGVISVNNRSAYGKFLTGYTNTGAWTGADTLRKVWLIANAVKADHCGWYQLGVMLGKMYNLEKLKL